MIMNASIIATPPCLISSAGVFSFCPKNGRISIFILRRCSEDVVICVQFIVVEFFAVLGPSPKYRLLSVRRVPFLSSMFDDQLDLFWRWNKPVWCCFPSPQSLFQCSFIQSFFAVLIYLLIFGSKKLSGANRPPIVALKCVAMFGSCSFSLSNLI